MSGMADTSIEDHIADVYSAARDLVHATEAINDADGNGTTAAVVQRDEAWHDLALAVNRACTICDPDTCPGYIANQGATR